MFCVEYRNHQSFPLRQTHGTTASWRICRQESKAGMTCVGRMIKETVIIITASLRIQHKRPECERRDWATEKARYRSIYNCALRRYVVDPHCISIYVWPSQLLWCLLAVPWPSHMPLRLTETADETNRTSRQSCNFRCRLFLSFPRVPGIYTWNRYPKACAMVAHLILAASNLCKLELRVHMGSSISSTNSMYRFKLGSRKDIAVLF
ncbi:MAG: hypothetical protein J3Q66DRAFT_17406 [Benniella sp.]|nr:MAG: hypothetical protein J3Q66DRAFT_17406 [Benniella sp.]